MGETGDPVNARAGYTVQLAYAFDEHPKLDVLLVSGGVHHGEMEKTKVIHWLQRQAQGAALITSVCTGVFLLAQAGIVKKQQVTTHHQDIPELKALFPDLDVVENVRWAKSGIIISSGGISAGIDMSLYLVSQLAGVELAEKTANQMEFHWRKNRG